MGHTWEAHLWVRKGGAGHGQESAGQRQAGLWGAYASESGETRYGIREVSTKWPWGLVHGFGWVTD